MYYEEPSWLTFTIFEEWKTTKPLQEGNAAELAGLPKLSRTVAVNLLVGITNANRYLTYLYPCYLNSRPSKC